MLRHRLRPALLGLLLLAPGLPGRVQQEPLRLPHPGADRPAQLLIHLADELRGRAADGAVHSLAGGELGPFERLAAAEGLRFQPLVRLPEARVEALRARAAARSGRPQPDLLGWLVVEPPAALDPAGAERELLRLGRALRSLPQVDQAILRRPGWPPPTDLAPPTPDYSANQAYLQADPGVNAVGAWSIGLSGAGVRLSDVEYAWDSEHEEYNSLDLNPEPGQTIPPTSFTLGFDDHGTAVLGIAVAADHGYGVTGISSGVETATYPEDSVEEGPRRVAAILSAAADSGPGDLIVLEMQTDDYGPNPGDYGPAELDSAVFQAVQLATDAGVVVIAAAGNGGQDLDDPIYDFWRNRGDSGAILVGAGSPDLAHDALAFSSFGSRVDVQGWGENVFSAGYGDFALLGGDDHQSYTAAFGGTSSATAMVAGVAALVQERSIALNGVGLGPYKLRTILRDTGVPQGAGGHIGPLPDAAAAAAAVGPYLSFPWTDLGFALGNGAQTPALTPLGELCSESHYVLALSQAAILKPNWLVVGFSNLSAPFKGGVLVPAADLVIPGPQVSFGGQASISGYFPPAIPPGVKLYFQWWIQDPAGPAGFTASNAWEGTTQ